MNNRRIVEVAGEKSQLVPERITGYRVALVRSLGEVIAVQNEGLSERGRRDRVYAVVEALGGRVAAEGGA